MPPPIQIPPYIQMAPRIQMAPPVVEDAACILAKIAPPQRNTPPPCR